MINGQTRAGDPFAVHTQMYVRMNFRIRRDVQRKLRAVDARAAENGHDSPVVAVEIVIVKATASTPAIPAPAPAIKAAAKVAVAVKLTIIKTIIAKAEAIPLEYRPPKERDGLSRPDA